MKRLFNRIIKPPSTDDLRRWFGTTPGRELLAMELDCLEQLLSECFGYYLLQVGCLGLQMDPLRMSRIKSQVVLVPREEDAFGAQCVVSDPQYLPIASDSIDTVLLSHTLDFSKDPHQLLREVERVLIPEGHVIIVGFNPWSLWGIWRFLRMRSKRVPWCGHFISSWRVHDWLSLLGFEIKAEQGVMFRPPLGRERMMQRLGFLERIGERFWSPLSGVYMILAVKRVSRLTPIKPAWKLRPRRIRGGMAEPSANNIRHTRSRD
ncbi:class I SAM-dependent methyltransferase [Sedimenticola sp.]|uniref:class I SAM-dependent methyltransferase n=1 Tax=Sedimenticola sp. TaxID=1940285 RepID=UPI003D0DE0EF